MLLAMYAPHRLAGAVRDSISPLGRLSNGQAGAVSLLRYALHYTAVTPALSQRERELERQQVFCWGDLYPAMLLTVSRSRATSFSCEAENSASIRSSPGRWIDRASMPSSVSARDAAVILSSGM